MAVEQISPEQQSIASEAHSTCQESQAQVDSQAAVEAAKKAKEEIDKAMQQLANLPYDLIGQLQTAIETLLKIINGYENPATFEFNASSLISQLEGMLNPVIGSLSSLPVPEVPGLSDISNLLSALSSLLSSDSSNEKPPKPNEQLPDIPPELINILKDLLISIQSLCATLPLVLINVIFQMLNTIISLFQQIAGVIGVPNIPYPLSLVPNCISMVPQIMDLMLNLPSKLNGIAMNALRKKIKNIQDMQLPEMPDDIEEPKQLPACPQRG